MTLCRTIGHEIAAVPASLPEPVLHASTRAIVDWFAAATAGENHPATVALRATVAPIAGTGKSTIVGWSRRVDARSAALVNATASHAVEVDDIYRDGIYHPGAPTIAAALAVGQSAELTGKDLLRAIAIGYEIGCRVATAINPAHYRFWHTTGTVGSLGAAAAAGAALGLDAQRLGHAIAISATAAAGLQQSFRSEAMAKPLHAGHASDVGVLSALAAANGMTGALDVLEGPVGFGAAMAEGVDWSLVGAPFGDRWAVESITVKNHTACGHTFAPIDAMLAIRSHHEIDLSAIDSIVVEAASLPLQIAGNLDPMTAFEAKFSVPYCIASALLVGSVRLAAFRDEMLFDPAIRSLIARTELRVTPEFDRIFPTTRAARVTVTLRNGEQFSEEAWTRKGDPEAPLSDDEISSKFTELVSPSLGQSTKAVLDSLWEIGKQPSIADVLQGVH